MSTTFRRLGPSEILPRYIFAENLFVRRRVLEVGAVKSTQGASGQFLSQRGARWVMSCDDDVAAVEDAQKRLGSHHLRYRACVFDDLEPQSMDLVLVADLGPYVHAPQLLMELARLVAKTGYLMGGLRNPGGMALAQLMEPEEDAPPPTYGQLLDALAPYFASVEVATQSPVLGYQLAFDQVEGLQVDGSLAASGEAAYFVVLAGQQPYRSAEPTWVQLAPEPLAFTGGKLEDSARRTRDWEERSRRLKESLEKTKEELEERTSRVQVLAKDLESAREEGSHLLAKLEQAQGTPSDHRERDELTHKVRRLEAELQVAGERALDAEKRLAQHRQEAEDAQRANKAAQVDVLAAHEAGRLERVRREELAGLLEDTRQRLSKAYAELKAAQEDVASSLAEREKGRLVTERSEERLRALEREIQAGKEREVKLGEAHANALVAVDAVQGEVVRLKRESEDLRGQLDLKEAEIARVERAAEADALVAKEAAARVEAHRSELGRIAQEREAERMAHQTESASFNDARERLTAELAARTDGEQKAKDLAASLEEQLAVKRQEAADLATERAQLQAELNDARAAASRLERQSEQIEVLLAPAQARVRELEADADRLLDQVRELKDALADMTRAREADHQRGEALAKDLAEANHQLELVQAAHAAERAALEATRSEGEARLSALEQDASLALEAERAKLRVSEAAVQQLRDDLHEAKVSLGAARDEREDTHKQLEASQADADGLRGRVSALETTEAELRRALGAAETEALDALQRVEDAQERVSAALADAERARAEAAEAREAAAQAAAQTASGHEKALAELREAAAQTASEHEKALAELREAAEQAGREHQAALERRLREGEEALARARTEAADVANQANERVAQAQEAAAAEVARLGAELEALRATEQSLRAEHEDLKARGSRSIEDSLAAAAETASLRERASTAEELKGTLEAQLTALKGELEKSRAQAKAAQDDLSARDQKMRALQQQADRATRDFEAAAQRLEAAFSEQRVQAEVRNEMEQWVLRSRVRMRELEEKLAKAQTAAQASGVELPELKDQVESLSAENRILSDERERLVSEVERLESDRAQIRASLDEHTTRLETAQRRMAAQEAELSTLRRSMGRQSPGGVQQIYERAQAGLSAVKEQIQRRPGVTPAPAPATTAPPAAPPAAAPIAVKPTQTLPRFTPAPGTVPVVAKLPPAPAKPNDGGFDILDELDEALGKLDDPTKP